MSSALIDLCATARKGMSEMERQEPRIENVIIHTLAALISTVSREPADISEAQEQRYVRQFIHRLLTE